MAVIDLDKPRSVTRSDRREDRAEPSAKRARVYVTPSGRVVIGDEVPAGEEHQLSEVHPAVFA